MNLKRAVIVCPSSRAEPFQVNLTAACNFGCECHTTDVEPVCGNNGLTYFSPCHAGCTELSSRSNYTNCACKFTHMFVVAIFLQMAVNRFYLGILMFCITVFTSPYGLYQTYIPQIKHWNYLSLLDFIVLLAAPIIESVTSQMESLIKNHCKPISHCCFNWKYLSHTLFRPSTFSYDIVMRISYNCNLLKRQSSISIGSRASLHLFSFYYPTVKHISNCAIAKSFIWIKKFISEVG